MKNMNSSQGAGKANPKLGAKTNSPEDKIR
jgi:hypothetical protein